MRPEPKRCAGDRHVASAGGVKASAAGQVMRMPVAMRMSFSNMRYAREYAGSTPKPTENRTPRSPGCRRVSTEPWETPRARKGTGFQQGYPSRGLTASWRQERVQHGGKQGCR